MNKNIDIVQRMFTDYSQKQKFGEQFTSDCENRIIWELRSALGHCKHRPIKSLDHGRHRSLSYRISLNGTYKNLQNICSFLSVPPNGNLFRIRFWIRQCVASAPWGNRELSRLLFANFTVRLRSISHHICTFPDEEALINYDFLI